MKETLHAGLALLPVDCTLDSTTGSTVVCRRSQSMYATVSVAAEKRVDSVHIVRIPSFHSPLSPALRDYIHSREQNGGTPRPGCLSEHMLPPSMGGVCNLAMHVLFVCHIVFDEMLATCMYIVEVPMAEVMKPPRTYIRQGSTCSTIIYMYV